MKRLLAKIFFVQLLTYSELVPAYEVLTHEDMSQKGLEASILATPSSVLANLGLKAIDDPQELFPNFGGKKQIIIDLIRYGANQEDNLRGSRFLHHFYDPYNNSALTAFSPSAIPFLAVRYGQPFLPTQKSFDWALEDSQDLGGDQIFSFKDARQYFFDALTKGVDYDRNRSFGLTFQTLGHVIHHIQDMAQPQHVKNEPHPPYVRGSMYEHYTDEDEIRKALPFTGYNPVFSLEPGKDYTTFNTPRKLWETGDGRGLAEFTNHNFITYGHNFIGSLTSVEPNPSYPKPDGTTAQTTAIDGPIVPNLSLDLTPLDGKMYFIGTPVTDNYRSDQSKSNNLTSTFSIYDDDLKQFQLRVTCLPTPSEVNLPPNCTQEAVFSVNRFTMRAAHSFLIPRAVAYSAGLINFFFRGVGKIDLIPDPQNVSGYLIQNLSEETLKGTFYLYYDDEHDVRMLYQTWPTNGDLLPHGQLAVAGFPSPTDPNHMPKNPGQYMLVFKGRMGQEGDDPSILNNNPNFAVAANSINFGSGGLILTSGGDARGFALPGNGGSVTIETGASLNAAPAAAQVLEINSGATVMMSSSQVMRYSQISIRGTLELQGDVTLSSDGPVFISGTIKVRSATNPQDGANLTIESTGSVVVSGRIDASGQNADPESTGDQNGGFGGNVIIRTASTDAFAVPTIITRGGDAALIDTSDPAQQNLTGGHGGNITITTLGSTPGIALQFAGERLPDSAVDPLPKQQGVHTLPTRTTFHRGLLTTGGSGGQFGGFNGTTQAGAPGGDGGDITIECQQPAQVQFAETDLFTGGNIDVILSYQTEIVFTKGDRPRFQSLVQRTGSMGGQGAHGVSLTNGGDGGPGGNAGAITVSPTCTLAPAPTTLRNPPRLAPLFDGVDPRTGFSSKLPIVEALDTAGNRLYTLQAFGGGGGIPGGSGLSLARCASTSSACFVEDGAGACPLLANGSAQLCLPVPGIEPSPGNYGARGADGPVSCLTLGFTPPSPAQEGLVCQ